MERNNPHTRCLDGLRLDAAGLDRDTSAGQVESDHGASGDDSGREGEAWAEWIDHGGEG